MNFSAVVRGGTPATGLVMQSPKVTSGLTLLAQKNKEGIVMGSDFVVAKTSKQKAAEVVSQAIANKPVAANLAADPAAKKQTAAVVAVSAKTPTSSAQIVPASSVLDDAPGSRRKKLIAGGLLLGAGVVGYFLLRKKTVAKK